MDIAERECSVDRSSAATLPSENFPHLACWGGLACKKFYFQQLRLGTCRTLCCDNCCMGCVHCGTYKKSRSKDLSGLASTSVRQLLETSCLVQPAQMSEAPSTSSLEVLKGQWVQGPICEKISIIVIPTLTTSRRSGTCTPMPAQSVLTKTWMILQKKYQNEIISHSQTRSRNQPSLSPCPLCRRHRPFWQSPPCLASCTSIPAPQIWDAANQLRESVSVNNLWLDRNQN